MAVTLFRTAAFAACATWCSQALRRHSRSSTADAAEELVSKLQKDSMEDLKLWLEESSEPTLVFLGDSSINILGKAMREMFSEYEEYAGAEYFPEEAKAIMSSESCPHSVEGVYTSYFGAPLNLTLHRVGIHSRLADDQGCFDKCLVDTVAALQPGAVVWNLGLHLMHMYPERPCVAEPEKHNYHNCGDYEELVYNSAAALMEVTPVLVWRTTNAICEAKLGQSEQTLLAAWRDDDDGEELEEKCQEECQLGDNRTCADELADSRGAELQRRLSLKAITDVSRDIALLDAYTLTEGRCNMTLDGQHYDSLSYDEVASLSFILASRAA